MIGSQSSRLLEPLAMFIITALLLPGATAAVVFEKRPCDSFNNLSTSIECSMYTATDACESLPDDIPASNDPPDQNVKDLTVKVKRLEGYPLLNYAEITWKSHNYLALNRTQAFTMSIKHFDNGPDLTTQLCRFFEVNSSSAVVSHSDAEGTVFGYISGYLPDKTYQVEVHTYPKPRNAIPTPTIVTFYTRRDGFEGVFPDPTTTTTTTTTESPTLNTTIGDNTETPYTASVTFYRALPNDLRYNHTKYELNLFQDQTWTRAKNIFGVDFPTQDFAATQNGEDVRVTHVYSKLPPGPYTVRVYAHQWVEGVAGCLGRCIQEDNNSVYEQLIHVKGADYEPLRDPILTIEESDVSIDFYVAHAALLIDYYTPVIRNQDGKQRKGEIYKPNDSGVGDNYNLVTIKRFSNLKKHFSVGDMLTLEMLPTAVRSLCDGELNMYNYNGTCIPFSSYKSAAVPLPKIGVPVNTGAIVGGLIGAAAFVVLIVAIVCFLNRRSSGRRLKDICHREAGPPPVPIQLPIDTAERGSLHVDGDTIVGLISSNPAVPVCVAYVRTPAYEKLAGELKIVLEKFFNCNVEFYTGQSDRSSTTQGCIIVLHSEPLYRVYTEHFKQDSVSHRPDIKSPTQDLHPITRILDILQTPKPNDTQTIMLVTFEHLMKKHSNELVVNSGVRVSDLFTLPEKLESLTKKIHSPSSDVPNVECPAWRLYENSRERGSLERAIVALKSEQIDLFNRQDSAYESMSLATYQTVATMSPSSIEPAPDAPTFISAEPPERFHTITPQAPEKDLLPRQQSVETPTTSGSEQPLLRNPPVAGYGRGGEDTTTYVSVATETGTEYSYSCSTYLPPDVDQAGPSFLTHPAGIPIEGVDIYEYQHEGITNHNQQHVVNHNAAEPHKPAGRADSQNVSGVCVTDSVDC